MQTTNRLGCLTGTGMVAALITMLVLASVAFVSGGQMFSSGGLNAQTGESVGGANSHAQISECEACHAAPWDADKMADRCLACHTEIKEQMLSVAELHGAITRKDPDLACRDCHFEHRGPTASLTEMGEHSFPHEKLGYSLAAHQFKATNEAFTCSDCHGEDIGKFASDSCQTFHNKIDIAFTQAHIFSFGGNCLACHDGVDRYDDDFDHNSLPFQLTGAHTEAACTGCHLDAREIKDLQSTPQDCYSCHYLQDEHAGQFGTQCEACHTPDNWEGVSFDHSLSDFPLTGAHIMVRCESCHINNVFVGTQAACVACHADPAYHVGAFGTDCASCHSTSSWSPASFNLNHPEPQVDEGGSGINHGGATCRECHPTSFSESTCVACHDGNNFEGGEGGD